MVLRQNRNGAGRLPKRQKKSSFLLLSLALVVTSMLLLCRLTSNNRMDWDVPIISTYSSSQQPGLLPIDLSMNNLQVISRAPGALPQQIHTEEDFLPITSSDPELRFRLRPTAGASHAAIRDISAYRVECIEAHHASDTDSSPVVLWDSGKVTVPNGMPTSIPWGGKKLRVGSIVKWRVYIWDFNGVGMSTSDWHKFAVGPSTNEWKADWITHPTDLHSFQRETNLWRHGVNFEQCANWQKRRDLPIMRSKFTLSKKVSSALLVVSGLGSFQARLNGKPLSTSSVLDPPLTDFTKRVSYRGYDVTKLLQSSSTKTHVVSILLGSAWWDSRPLTCCIVSINLLPRGSLTCIAQLHVKYKDGTRDTIIPTSTKDWEVAKGYLRESDLFTGEVVDLEMQQNDKQWNWIQPEVYTSPISREQWRQDLSERSDAKQKHENEEDQLRFTVAPIGKLLPCEIPPVMPIERIAPESIVNLGNGRWLFDFAKGMSGVLRFDKGLPNPIVPKDGYPRGHSVITRSKEEAFVTVVYGDSLELETGDINLALVAGMGLREKSRGDVPGMAGPCFPKDHGNNLLQRDVYIASSKSKRLADARQPLFTTQGFRFAEVCCTEEPPKGVYAVAYRTAFEEWGRFDSSNVLLNGAHELTRNALNSNMLGTQTDCPHREKLQYGGDLVSDSAAAMHFFDLSAFYSKIIHDWGDTQWDNGAYTETSIWQELNDYAGIGHGAGETVWASLPAILMVRHVQQYGDLKFATESLEFHVNWLEFLKTNWEEGMKMLFYDRVGNNLENYDGNRGGLGDWLSILSRDTFLTHNSFFMATARSVAYLAEKLGKNDMKLDSLVLADKIKSKINSLYMRNDDDGFRIKSNLDLSPGPELALWSRIVPGQRRCKVVDEWIRIQTNEEPVYGMSDEEKKFFYQLNKKDLEELERLGIVVVRGSKRDGIWKRGHNMPEGILAVRYNLRAMSELGYHQVALEKAAGIGYPSFEYMMSHNATTLWETWFRSEDVFSRDHPMLGAVAEWLPASVAGVQLDPKAVGGDKVLFWPRIHTSARIVQYASATQGTKRGDASIAWEFLNVPPEDSRDYDSAVVKVHIRVLVPPASTARFMLPSASDGNVVVKFAEKLPNLKMAKSKATTECDQMRRSGRGFEYNWEFDPSKKEWRKVHRKKAIGTRCKSFLFNPSLQETRWSPPESVPLERNRDTEISLNAGLYDFVIDKWQLSKDGNVTSASYCSDPDSFSWDIHDATHII